MIKRWLSYILIYFILSAALFTIAVTGKPNQTADQHQQSAQQKPQSSVASKNNDPANTYAEKTDSNPPKWYTSLERPEWWLVIVGFLTLIFIAWQAYETKLAVQGAADSVGAINKQIAIMERQANEMQEQRGIMQGQLGVMKGQLELEHRPWVAVVIKPISPIVFDQRGCVLMCEVTMTNVGHSAAKHVSLWTDFALLGIENPTEIRDRLCDIMRHPQNKSSDYGWLLFPGQNAVEQRPIIAVPERTKQALENKTFQGLNAIGLHLVGCVDYPSPIDNGKRHQTRFEYTVSFVNPLDGSVRGAFDPSQKIYQHIVLMPTMHGASAD
jgi:hypothetical protein